ncbi:MAG: hypothetical protein RIQ93_1354 [Verrucomicrobiota bacterium]|jgi:hypothetical protein
MRLNVTRWNGSEQGIGDPSETALNWPPEADAARGSDAVRRSVAAERCRSGAVTGRMLPPGTYIWRLKTRLPDRKGQWCRVLARGRLNSCLVEFNDGVRVVTSRWAVRKVRA